MTYQLQSLFRQRHLGASSTVALPLKRIRSMIATGLALLLLAQPSVHGQDNWPRFRGSNADGVAPDNAGLPTTWTATENAKWVADVPGWGWSCPVVWGDRVFLSTVVSDENNLAPSKGLYLGQGVREPAKGVHLVTRRTRGPLRLSGRIDFGPRSLCPARSGIVVTRLTERCSGSSTERCRTW